MEVRLGLECLAQLQGADLDHVGVFGVGALLAGGWYLHIFICHDRVGLINDT